MTAVDHVRDWLWLTQAPGVGAEAVRRLLAAFGDAAGVAAAGPGGWRSVTSPDVAQALGARRPEVWQTRLAAARRWLDDAPERRRLWTIADADYPPALRQLPDPPVALFAEGDTRLPSAGCVAMVGSRRASAQGLELAREFAAGLSAAGLTVISGLAQGIDGAAHEGALRGAGRTVAVVGTGLDQVYPRRHLALAEQIAREGLLLSEYPPGTPPLPAHFPRRNRIIAGLSVGTLVVEAAQQSGSLITARLALEYGREVLAIPGSIRSQQSGGCHQLIRDGATLVTSVQDVLGCLLPLVATQLSVSACATPPVDAAGTLPPATDEHPLLAAMGGDPTTLDQLTQRTGWSAEQLQIELLTLELEGRVGRLPGGLFQGIGFG